MTQKQDSFRPMLLYHVDRKLKQIILCIQRSFWQGHGHHSWELICFVRCFAIKVKLLESVAESRCVGVSDHKQLVRFSFICHLEGREIRTIFLVIF